MLTPHIKSFIDHALLALYSHSRYEMLLTKTRLIENIQSSTVPLYLADKLAAD